MAVGGARGAVRGENVTAAFVTIVGRRRAPSVLGLASNDDVLTQIMTFLDTIDVASVPLDYRNDLNAARRSDTKSCGCSHAAKWPPLSSLLK